MSKRKKIITAGLVAATGGLLYEPEMVFDGDESPLDKVEHAAAKFFSHDGEDASNIETNAFYKDLEKREARKVYHRFEDIPEISDAEAMLYHRGEYVYVVNAEVYQKDGKVKLKRVLRDEVTEANTLSVMYRTECADYVPKKGEDQLVRYDLDFQVLSPSGTYKGPSQMDDNTITGFIKYLAAAPQTRRYVLPLLQTSDGTLAKKAFELQQCFFAPDGNLRTMDERNKVTYSQLYQSIKLNPTAWERLANHKTKQLIARKQAEVSAPLSATTKTYLYLTEVMPKKLLQRKLEDYNLSFYVLGRNIKPCDVMNRLATNLNLRTVSGKPDATRLPLPVISAVIEHINWKGNGLAAYGDTQKKFSSSPRDCQREIRQMAKTWVNGKGRKYGVDEMYQLNMLTPTIISQYQKMELAGATELCKAYELAVDNAEKRITITAYKSEQQSLLADNSVKMTLPLKKGYER